MKLSKKYRITVEDQSSLQKKVDFSASISIIVLIFFGAFVLIACIGFFMLATTPLKSILPGYLKQSERSATEEQYWRLDSLLNVYETNEAYINSILSALYPSDSLSTPEMQRRPNPISLDSLLPASIEERLFMESIRERDKYNVSYVSPAVAQNMIFENVNKSAIISKDSEDKYQADIILPVGAPVASIAEGKVISVASSPRVSGGYEVIIQHPNGFLSKTGRLANLTVRPGDRVAPGQIIALSTSHQGMKNNHIVLELWHDGDRLIPSRYINL